MIKGKRIVAALLIFFYVFISSQEIVLAVAQQLTPIRVDNGFVEYTVNPGNGRFSIKTVKGTAEGKDSDSLLLYLKEVPETSFTTFRINGEDYIYGNNYGFLGNDGVFTKPPAQEGLNTSSVWTVKGLEITQSINLVTDLTNPHLGNVKVSYRVKNTSGSDIEIGTRILLDTMLGDNDGSPLSLPFVNQYITTERRLDEIPDYWRSSDKAAYPDIVSYGLLKGWGNVEPDSMIVAHWQGLSRSKWDYTPDPTVDFTTKRNKYNSADSAVAIYWEPAAIGPGEEKVFETYYGLGDFRSKKSDYNYNIRIFAPDRMAVNETKDGYIQETFDITVELNNNLPDSRILDHPKITLDLSVCDGALKLAPGEEETKSLGNHIMHNQIHTVKWKVVPQKQREFTAAQFVVRVEIDGVEDMITGGFVMLPSMSGLPPNIQVHGIAPSKMYYKDEIMKAALQGSGFGVLMLPDTEFSLRLLKESDKSFIADIPEDFRKITTTGIEINLGKEFWQQSGYPAPENEKFIIELDASPYGLFRHNIEFTTDETYKSSVYNILAVVENNKKYSITPLKDETELVSLKKSKNVLMEIKGKIIKRASNYEVYDGALINSTVLFKKDPVATLRYGENSQKIVIEEKSNGLFMNGHGLLSIPSYTFTKGLFKIEFKNGTMYSLDPDEDKDEEPVVIRSLDTMLLNLFIFPVTVKHAELGENSVSFGGTLHLSFFSEKTKEKSTDETEYEETGISVDLDEARFGRKGDTLEFIGLRAEGEAKLAKDLIPGLEFGGEASAKIDTIDNIYEVEAEMKFKVLELYGKLAIVIIDGFPVPDAVSFAIAGEPGVPIVPVAPVAYITRAGGGFENLVDTIRGNYNVLPPLTLKLYGGLDIAKVFKADPMELSASLRGLSVKSGLEIAKIKILKEVYSKMEFKDSKEFGVRFESGATLELFDVITGRVYFIFEYDKGRTGIFGPVYLEGGGSCSISTPQDWDFLGGIEILNAAVRLSTEQIYAKVKIIGISTAISYEWGSSKVDFELFANSSMEDGNFFANNITLVASTKPKTDPLIIGDEIYLAHLGNESMPLIINSFDTLSNSITIYEGNLGGEIDIQDQENALIQLSYFGDSGEYQDLSIDDIGITDPEGRPYNLISNDVDPENANALLQTIPKDVSESGMTERHIFISINYPMNGKWKFFSDKPVGMVQLMNVDNLPEISDVAVEQNSDDGFSYTVRWGAHNIKDEKVAIYLCDDNVNHPGFKIADNIDASARIYNGFLPDEVESGKYYVKVVLYKGETNLEAVYSNETIEVTNPREPRKPENLDVTPIGDGLLKVSWSEVSDGEGYYVQVFDQDGEPIEGVGVVETGAGETEVVIGGTFADSETGELMGLIPGRAYKVGVTAFRNVDGALYIGKTAMSSVVSVPVPNPAVINLSIGSADPEAVIQNGTIFNGMPVYAVNTNNITLTLKANQNVASTILLNDNIAKRDVTGSVWAETLVLDEGNNIIEVLAINDHGDSTIGKVSVICDTTPPALAIESAERIEGLEDEAGIHSSVPDVKISRMSENEKYLLRGITEPGAKVTVDENQVAVSEEGVFETQVSLSGFTKRNIVITAVDSVSNTSRIEIPVLNDKVKNFKDIVIKEAGGKSPLTTTAMYTGAVKNFAVYGVTDDGEFLIDPKDIKWNIILGDALGEVSDEGALHAYKTGELILTASYKVSEEYTFEEGVKVVISKAPTPAPDHHY